MVGTPSVKKCLLGALLLVVFASACSVGDACEEYKDLGLVPDDSPEARQLATMFAPVVYLVGHEGFDGTFDTDPYAPTSVSAFLDEQDMRLLHRKFAVDDEPRAYGPVGGERIFEVNDDYYLDLFENVHPRNYEHRDDYDGKYQGYEERARSQGQLPTVYARVVSHEGKTVVQYWFFYYFNDWVNRHEGDFEVVQLLFQGGSAREVLAQPDPQPEMAGYSQHTGGWRYEWSDVKREPEGSRHPLVFVAAGSHSNYNAQAFWHAKVDFWVAGCDWTRKAGTAVRLHESTESQPRTPPHSGDLAYKLEVMSPAEVAGDTFAWTEFEGHWGELSFISYSGPEGLPETKPWRDPWKWNKKKLSGGEQGKCAMRQEPQRSAKAGERLLEYLGQEITIDDIPRLVGDVIIFIITWPGSDIELTLEKPDRTIIDGRRDAVVKHEEGKNYEMYRLENADPGIWKMHLKARKLDDGAEETVRYEVFDLPPLCDDSIATAQATRDADLDGIPNAVERPSKIDPCNWDTDGNEIPDMDLATYFSAINKTFEDYDAAVRVLRSPGDVELEDDLSDPEVVILLDVIEQFFKFTDRVAVELDAPPDAELAHDALLLSLEDLRNAFEEVQKRINDEGAPPYALASAVLEDPAYDDLLAVARDACLDLQQVGDDLGMTSFLSPALCDFDELVFPDA